MEPVPDVEESIRAFFRVCQRRKSSIFASTASMLLVSICACGFTTPRYTARSVIQIQKPSSAGTAAATESELQSQANILQSQPLVLKVIDELKLEQNEDIQSPHFSVPDWAAGLTKLHGPADPRNLMTEDSPAKRRRVVKAFQANLRVKVTPQTRQLEVDYTNRDPKLAAAIANHLVEAFADYTLQTRITATNQTSQWLEGQLADLRNQSEELQSKLAVLQQNGAGFDRSPQGKPVVYSGTMERLQDSAAQLSQARMNCLLKAAVLEVVKTGDAQLFAQMSQTSIGSAASPAVHNSLARIQQLRHEQPLIQAELARDSAPLRHAAPKVARERASLKTVQQSLKEEFDRAQQSARDDLDAATKAEQASQAAYEAKRTVARELNDKSVDYATLSREAEQSQQLYLDLLKRLNDAGMLEVLHSSNVTVVSKAEEPANPSNPRIPLYLALGAGWGVVFGCCTALLVDAVETRKHEDLSSEPWRMKPCIYPRQIELNTTPVRRNIRGLQSRQQARPQLKRFGRAGVILSGLTLTPRKELPGTQMLKLTGGGKPEVLPLAGSSEETAPAQDISRQVLHDWPVSENAETTLPSAPEPLALPAPSSSIARREESMTEQDPIAQQDSITQQDENHCVVLAIGLPGSGKTSWFKRKEVTPLSADTLRGSMFEDIADPRYERLVLTTLKPMLRARLLAKVPVNYVDANNLTAQQRKQWIKIAVDAGYEVHAVYFDIPLEVCLERNRRRGCKISIDEMGKMAARLRAPSLDEGFSKITTVRLKKARLSGKKEVDESAKS